MRRFLRASRLLSVVSLPSAEGQSRQIHLKLLPASKSSRFLVSNRTKVWSSQWPSIGSIDSCVYGQLTRSIEKYAKEGKTAMICAEDPQLRYSYAELGETIKGLEGFLHEAGFQQGDVVTSVMVNCIEFPAVFIATIGRGGAFSGASAQFTPEELARQFNDNNSKIVFVNQPFLQNVMKAVEQAPSVEKIVCIKDHGSAATISADSKIFDFHTVIKSQVQAPSPSHGISDVAVLPYSSGTTGTPKGVQLTHINFLTAVVGYKNHSLNVIRPQLKKLMGDFEINGNFLYYLPFYHVYGKVTLMSCLLRGETAVSFKKFDPALFYKSVEEYKPWCLYLVPPIAIMLTKDPNTVKYDFSSVRYAVCGAAPLGADIAAEFQKKFPNIFLTQGYGMSETALCSFFPPCEEYGSFENVGRVAPEFEAKVVDVATGRELDVGETGELCLRGQAIMKGYLNKPEDTAGVIDEDGWFHTGDVGYFNEKGEMYIVDRIKELIKVKGLQVAPAELESILVGHEKILDVAVIGTPHDELGEAPRAFVVKKDGSLTEAEVKNMIAERLAKYKRLEGGVFFVDQIPKSPAGKILRRELKELRV